MNNQLKNYLQKSLIALDLLVLNVTFLVSRVIFEERIAENSFRIYLELWVLINAFWIIISFVCRTYSDSTIVNFEYFTKDNMMKALTEGFLRLVKYMHF